MNTPSRIHDEQTGKVVVCSPAETDGATNTSREYVTSSTGDRPAFQKFVEDEAYKEALGSLVVACVDIVIFDLNTGRVLVGTRDQEPQPADWVIGGRKRAGESDHQSAVRNIRRELGEEMAEFADAHLQPIGTKYDLVWDTREQDATINEAGEPVEGCHMSSSPMALAISETTFNAIALPNEEYRGLRWEDGFEIYEAPAGTYHPAHQDMVFDMLERVATRP